MDNLSTWVPFFDTFEYIIDIFPYLLGGLYITLKLAVVGIVGGLLLGLPLAIIKTYGKGFLKWTVNIYIEVIRGTPLILQIFIIYFGLPEIGIQFDRMLAGWIALAVNSSAYQAEYFRGAFNSVERGQIAAARSLGMGTLEALRHITIPQAIRLVMPSWSNEVVYNVKNAAITFTIAIPELLSRGQILAGRDYRIIEVFLTVTLIYVIIVGIINGILQLIEKRIKIPGLLLEDERR